MKNFNDSYPKKISTAVSKENDERSVTRCFNYFDQIFSGLETDVNPLYDYPENSNREAAPTGCVSRTLDYGSGSSALTAYLTLNHISPTVFFMATFAYSLAKFSGQDESVFCFYQENNPDLLPLYLKIDETDLISDFLAGVQDNYQQTLAHTACSFEKLARDLEIKADLLFIYQADGPASIDFGAAKLAAAVFPNGDRFQIDLYYREDLYKQETIDRFGDLYEAVIQGFLNNNKLLEIPLISAKDQQACDVFNRTEMPYDTTLTMVSMLRNQAKKSPAQTALVYQDVRLSYQELDDVTDRLAKHIKSFGIGRKDIVPILLPKSEMMTIAAIGVLKAGAGYQPLDPTYPMERLEFMIKDTNANLLIADDAMLALVPDYSSQVILTKDISTLPDSDTVLEDPQPEDLFIMLYTSGSTGVPKGVMLEHRNVVSFCHWYNRYYSLDATANVIAYASFGFDANIMDTYPVLTVGGTLHIIADEIRLDLLRLNDYFETNGITHAFMTTQVGRQFAENIENHTLKHLSTGGEKLAAIRPPSYPFYNLYGPTETTVIATSFLLDDNYDNIPIGKALDNVKIYILDRFKRQVPIGVPGELCIAGVHVARGYLNRPDATAAAFGPNPFCAIAPNDRIYYSGDIVRYLPDGNIEFVGRRDAQIKIRGFRVELTEIETVIRQFPGIHDVTVVAYDDPSGVKYIVAYVVAAEPVDISALNTFIEAEKPPYMVPAVTMQIDKIPLNQNMKVNKKELPVPVKKLVTIVPPENDTQRQIFACVAKILGHEQFGITTDLQDAGLTSIGTVSLNVSLSKVFGVVVRTRDLKEHNTISKLETFLANAATILPVTAENKRDVYPVSQTQMGVFVESMAKPQELLYHIPFLFKLHEDVDLDRLKIAIEAAISAHAYLKTRFFMDETGEIMQKRRDDSPYTVRFKDYLEMDKLITPFKLIDGRLFNTAIYQTKTGNYFFIDIHHMICDGTSLAILVDDINKAYSGETLEPESYTGFEAALDEQMRRNSDEYTRAKAYYAALFEGCDSHFLPGPDKSNETASLGELTVIPENLDVAAVSAYCQAQQITPNAFFVGIFGYVLGRYHHKNHSVFTTIYNGRNDSRLARSLGMYVKTLPVYCNLDTTAAGLLTATKNQLMDSMDHDLYSFAEISRNFGVTPDILLAYQGDDFEFDTLAGLPCECQEVISEGAIAPISVAITIKEGVYHFNSAFRSDMYEDSSITALLTNLALAASQVLIGNDLSQITLLFDEEREMVNDPRFYGQTFVDLFGATAAKFPDHIAVKDKKGSISYAELDAASDVLAVQLLAAGVHKEDFIGVLSGRTREFIIGVIATMKAGAAYVPLDPEYPEDRLRYMLADSAADILLYVNEYQELTRFFSKTLINLDVITATSHQPDKSWMTTKPSSDDLAYMIYTSGSTGKPKGVMISHGNLSNMIFNEIVNQQVTEQTHCAQYSSFCFDASVVGIFPYLASGSSLYLFAEEDRKDAVKVCQILTDEAINVAVFPTQMGEIIIDNMTADSSLTHIVVGGEKLKHYYDRPYTVVNAYGPTESTVESTIFNVDQEYRNIPIGKSLINVRSYIVDEQMNPVPIGMPGELCHAGRQIARGYHNLPEKTAAAFVPNPFASGSDDQLMYRTGDMVRRRGDGLIEYIGRIDSQVKIRGYRIELSEIEGAMIAHPGIKETAVTVLEQAGNQYIVGYYTRPEGEIDPKVWHHLLLSQLPEYMIPTFYVHLDKMPVTPGGKIDKKALPQPETGLKSAEYVAPESTLEKQLTEIFVTTLGLETVSVLDDFFAIGGTSISATKVAMKCMTQQIPLAYADIFEYKTVRQLAEFIEKHEAESINPEDVIKNFDYPKLCSVLLKNNVKYLNTIKHHPLGDIILTGATGFLGAHVLKEYLDHYDGKVTCFIRKGKARSLEQRIKTMLVYYFDQDYEELFEKRIFCVEGDITNQASVANLATVAADTVINCAACVKHFVADDTLEKINVRGVENLIELCQQTAKQLIQISTVSIAGEGINGVPPRDKRISEDELYFNQSLENAYVHSKFLAERAVLAAVAEQGLRGKIMRVGNLMSRNSDGEFQINFLHNGFMRGLKGYKILKKFPVSAMNQPVEFSPIDATAHAILKLAETNPDFTVFHPYNNHNVFMADVLQEMNAYGFDIAVVNDEEFEAALKAGMADPEMAPAISGLIVYLTSDTVNTVYPIDPNNQFTTEVLYRIGHSWPITNETYMHKSIQALDGLGFFDIDEN
ncbi:non-ribosomal peptide synthetase [Acetobacterium woodii]|uniref:Bacitracin synthase 1 n=1 Tax=Acetobacterium woodii (strain ATCC 29683 / DSM 1030 / JCM 2381 / KCTC 1655 / WB1) TaxID=931626 RepID=H6LJ88_ACEWD|nr:non-ribosomal peptide synthetase [Acetobacterium woodii]AFA48651.1 bacitracin synthase 1 [Acetobacterium woodii DSM 1030]